MTNDIPNIIKTNMPGPVKSSGQAVKLEAVKVTETNGQPLPQDGKELSQLDSGQSVNNAKLREVVGEMNDFVQSVQRDLSFSMDEDSGHTVIKVMDSKSGELIRQIPSEDVLAIASQLSDVKDMLTATDSVPKGLLFSDST